MENEDKNVFQYPSVAKATVIDKVVSATETTAISAEGAAAAATAVTTRNSFKTTADAELLTNKLDANEWNEEMKTHIEEEHSQQSIVNANAEVNQPNANANVKTNEQTIDGNMSFISVPKQSAAIAAETVIAAAFECATQTVCNQQTDIADVKDNVNAVQMPTTSRATAAAAVAITNEICQATTSAAAIDNGFYEQLTTGAGNDAELDGTPTASIRSIGSLVCRICQTAENPEKLVSPCFCKGSLTYVHIHCLERWISTSHSTTCELCQFQYNTVQKLRYTMLQSLRLWYSRAISRRALQEDCQMFSLLTLVAFGIVGTLLVGIQYYFTNSPQPWTLGKLWTRGWLIFFLLTTVAVYFLNIYMLVKSQLSPWYRWWQSARDIRLILENKKPFRVPSRKRRQTAETAEQQPQILTNLNVSYQQPTAEQSTEQQQQPATTSVSPVELTAVVADVDAVKVIYPIIVSKPTTYQQENTVALQKVSLTDVTAVSNVSGCSNNCNNDSVEGINSKTNDLASNVVQLNCSNEFAFEMNNVV